MAPRLDRVLRGAAAVLGRKGPVMHEVQVEGTPLTVSLVGGRLVLEGSDPEAERVAYALTGRGLLLFLETLREEVEAADSAEERLEVLLGQYRRGEGPLDRAVRATSHNVFERLTAASGEVSPCVQRTLVRDREESVRRNLVEEHEWPRLPEVWEALARDPEPGVRRAVLSRPDCPPQLLPRLLRDPDAAVQLMATRHPLEEEDELWLLENFERPAAVWNVAERSRSQVVLGRLFADWKTRSHDPRLGAGLAANPTLPKAWLEVLAHEGETKTAHRAADPGRAARRT